MDKYLIQFQINSLKLDNPNSIINNMYTVPALNSWSREDLKVRTTLNVKDFYKLRKTF